MTTRELFNNIMHYGSYDRMPVIHWGGWPETNRRWTEEGYDWDCDALQFFGADFYWSPAYCYLSVFPSFDMGLYPAFEKDVLEETDEFTVYRDETGVIQKAWKKESCIPHFMDFTLKSAKEWDLYKARLQPDPARIPDDLDKRIANVQSSGNPIIIGTGSLMGWIRNWMGVENMSYLACEDPDCYADMVNTIADLVCWQLDKIISRMSTPPDMGFGWEDICGKTGPLVSPTIFRMCVAPGYEKIRAKLESYRVKLYCIDSDGDVEPLIKDWLDAGVNVQFPIEIGTWDPDPMKLRQKYGKELRIIGGINKLELEKGPAAIDAEIQRRLPLMKDGGYIPMPDHLITPGTSLDNYRYYMKQMRALRFN